MIMPVVSEQEMFSAMHQTTDQIIEQIRLACPKGDLPPTLFIRFMDQSGNRDIVIMSRDSLGDSLTQRQETLYSAGQAIGTDHDKQVLMVILASMSWGVIKPAKGEEHVMPSKSPRREEMIALTSMTADKKQAMSIIRLDRSADGVMIPLYSEHLSEKTPGSSVQNNLLPFFFEGYHLQNDQGQ